jgi:DNA polymerase elongation subunit (family B)
MYSYVKHYGKNLYLTSYDKNGNKKIQIKDEVDLTLFLPCNRKTDYKSYITNYYVEPVKFSSILEFKDFVDSANKGNLYGYFGNYHIEVEHIRNEKLYEDVKPELLKVFFFDIEVFTPDDFTFDTTAAEFPVTAITVIDRKTKKSIIWGLCPYKKHKDNILEYRKFSNESDMLTDFFKFIGEENPDILTGWNSNWFDIPYIYNRGKKLVPKSVKLMSPFKKVFDKTTYNEQRKQTYDSCTIVGTHLLDLQDIEHKYSGAYRTKSLNKAAQMYLKDSKLDYSEEGNLSSLFKNNPQKYIEYNYKDVELLYDIDKITGYLNRIWFISHKARMPIEKYTGTVFPVESIFYNKLMDRNLVFPPRGLTYENNPMSREEKLGGGHVKLPPPTVKGWTASIDVNSSYPHCIMLGNISPETKIRKKLDPEVMSKAAKMNDYRVINKKIDTECFKNANVTILPNGIMYRKDIKGILPELAEELYDERKSHKGEMQALRKKLDKGEIPEEKVEETKIKIVQLDGQQWAEKIILNGCLYGAFANAGFIFNDKEICNSITSMGRVVIQTGEIEIVRYLNNLLKTNVDYAIYIDTDSIYFDMQALVNYLLKKKPNLTKLQITAFIDNFFKTKIDPQLKIIFTDLKEYINGYKDSIVMGREIIGDASLWEGKKKRYVVRVYDDEGKIFKEPKLKIKGIQIVRGDTPEPIKPFLKKVIEKILNGESLVKYIKEVKKQILKMPIEDYASPKGLNKMDKYYQKVDGIHDWGKGTGAQVKGAIVHNALIKKLRLQASIKELQNGDKIKYFPLVPQNPYDIEYISFSNKLPEEFGLHKYLSKETQYYKVFYKFVETLSDILGIKIKKTLI